MSNITLNGSILASVYVDRWIPACAGATIKLSLTPMPDTGEGTYESLIKLSGMIYHEIIPSPASGEGMIYYEIIPSPMSGEGMLYHEIIPSPVSGEG